MKIFIILFFLFLIIAGCKNNPVTPVPGANDYMSLHVGDIRQLYYPYNPVETYHTLWKIAGKTYRQDSTEVFIDNWYSKYMGTKPTWTEYSFIRNGFFYGCLLDSASPYPATNPFWEQKLAEVNPKAGDTWLETPGVPDSEKIFMTARYIGDLWTPTTTFKDVYAMDFNGLLIYYTKYWGYIGTRGKHDTTDLFIVNYMKINGRELGKYVDMPSE